ncbi:DUF397 domain-containing protein [Streptomyces antnestii]|uniref:DUF397 domain-containing protein n=1 Tax=Streptomyces antnestii TaxID=2494256 RepID=A0A3S2YU97_9ACTN|nr:DUF397 domain-containing protein [Streptomyces sp. San01]RVU19551.1 DUF397 domain-containing protein [Streptomyces sp. San01]
MVQWQKSSFSGPGDGNECVELADADGTLLVRESDDPDIELTAAPAALAQLLLGVKSGRIGSVR